MLLNIKESYNHMELVNESLKSVYKERFLNQIFEEVSFYFSKKINPDKLTLNIIENIKLKNDLIDINFVTESFFILDLAFTYYKSEKNNTMTDFIQSSIIEGHLFYLENNYQGFDNIYFNEKDQYFIEEIVEKYQ